MSEIKPIHECPTCGSRLEPGKVEATELANILQGHTKKSFVRALASKPNAWIDVDEIIIDVWGAYPPESAEKVLYVTSRKLNKQIAHLGWQVRTFRELGLGSNKKYILMEKAKGEVDA